MKIPIKLLIFFSAVIYFVCLLLPDLVNLNYLETASLNTDLFIPGAERSEEKTKKEGFYLLYDTNKSEYISLSEEDFLISTVSLELSPLTDIEAIKAQAVAARSFYRYKKEENKEEKYDLLFSSIEPTIYADENYFEEKWGENYQEYREIIKSALKATENEVLCFEDTIACCSYYAISDGVTENAEEVWQLSYPYLIPVASPYDILSPYFETKTYFTPEEVKELLINNYPNAKFDFTIPYERWFSEITYTTSSSVKSVNICGFSVTGKEVRNIFSLRSTTFDIIYDGESFLFKTKGYGHGVGMSQTGASYMAQSGSDYREILAYYYPGTTLTKLL